MSRPEDRERFARTVRDLAAVWLSNEAPGVVPGLPFTDFREGTFVLGHGGRTPLAFADGHGTWLHWLGGAGSLASPPVTRRMLYPCRTMFGS